MASEAQVSNMDGWTKKVRGVYEGLPETIKGHRPYVVFEMMALDNILFRDMATHQDLAYKVGMDINELQKYSTRQNLKQLYTDLDAYYLERRDRGEFERNRLLSYKDKPLFPIFILSYGRPEKNSTLQCLETWDEQDVYDNTLIFTDKSQVEAYKKHHPKWHYYVRDCANVGERFNAVLDYCKEHKFKYALILEDDIDRFCYIKKGGIDFNSKCNTVAEELNSCYFRYWMHKGQEIFENNPDTVLIGMRNRACCHAEVTSIIGYQYAMRGGCPNLAFLIDVDRFDEVWKEVPPQHYSPQYDWAIQCAIVKKNKRWHLITAIAKHENMASKSVIGYTGDRIKLAEDYLKYYGVEDKFKISVIKSKLQSIKLTYTGELYDK